LTITRLASIGNHGHVLHTGGHDEVLRTGQHALRREVHGLLGRTALAVDGHAGTLCGRPADSHAVRAMHPACGPSG